ncbi:helix-turn-helix domain-containing protein [Actinomycetospora corticicola]|uniref:DNA-binding HxlR family transcriptional regulator n=1 Tax=Actinomycetospora corticicola TaxID=663602 RepID=A0A7Y9E2N3_9PSEU|nr:helix-turn-helix domain-containing protein [Actinomycetospora corticicola]NYD39815.1 DNA-binding HxlR family transcriptional regulator [Actinomycetospora corticicola]
MVYPATRTHETASNCTVALTLAQVGDRWTILILRELFYGASRFDQIHSVLRCPRNLLAERLERLVDDEIIERSSYQEPGQRSRPAYGLTDRGRDLFPVLLALMQWGDHYLAGDVPPVIAEHSACGGILHAVLECEHGHHPVSVDEIDIRPGPGAL